MAFLKLIELLRISDTVIALEKVVTPAILTLSKFVWPSTSKSPVTSKSTGIETVEELILSFSVPAVSNEIVSAEGNEIFVSASPLCWISCATLIDAGVFTASIIPLNVEIPETLTLSKFVWPSTSKS